MSEITPVEPVNKDGESKPAESNDSGNNGGGNSGGEKKDDAKELVMGEWASPSPGDGDSQPLACGEKGWHWGLFNGCCNGGALRFCQRWYCGACMYSRVVAMALDQNCCLCCLLTGWWYCG